MAGKIWRCRFLLPEALYVLVANEAPKNGMPLDIFADMLISRGARKLAELGLKRRPHYFDLEDRLMEQFPRTGHLASQEAMVSERWAELEAMHVVRRVEFGLAIGTKALVERVRHFFPMRASKSFATLESLLIGLIDAGIVKTTAQGNPIFLPAVTEAEGLDTEVRAETGQTMKLS